MSAEENITVVREMIAALDRSDWAAIEKHPGMGQTRKVRPMIHTIFPDYHHTIEQIMTDGERHSPGTFHGRRTDWQADHQRGTHDDASQGWQDRRILGKR